MTPAPSPQAAGLTATPLPLALQVSAPRGGPWRAEVRLPDGSRLVFASPLELARWAARTSWPQGSDGASGEHRDPGLV